MEAHKKQCVFLRILLLAFVLLHLSARNQEAILDKKFGIEEVYVSPSVSLEVVIPVLAEGTLENGSRKVYQLDWNLGTNSFTRRKNFPFDVTNPYYFENLKWNGEAVMFPVGLLENIKPECVAVLYEERGVLDGDLSVSITNTRGQQYQILTDEATYMVCLPGFYHALAGVEIKNTIYLLYLTENQEKLPIRYELNALEISTENGSAQNYKIENVPSSLTDFIYASINFTCGKWDSVLAYEKVSCISVDKTFFLHDRKSVYKIDLEQRNCKRIFSTVRSIPQAAKEQYSDITHTDIYGMGYYQGLFCLELLAEEGVGNDYFYVPFVENPIVYCRGSEDVSTMYLFPNC